jgi:hypothetical protein
VTRALGSLFFNSTLGARRKVLFKPRFLSAIV